MKQAVFTQVHKLALHLEAGEDLGTFSGWRCEHNTTPTIISMYVEDQSLYLPFKFINLLVPADVQAVQRLLVATETQDSLPQPPPESVLQGIIPAQSQEDGKEEDQEEEQEADEEDARDEEEEQEADEEDAPDDDEDQDQEQEQESEEAEEAEDK